jgi:flagellin
MGLRINTNVSAINAHRNLSITNAMMAKSMERLSSGYRINRAGDDAAGLAIANAFRADVRALKVNQQNATQAVAVLQVAEGGANQIEGMIERLVELANQAASDNVGDDANGERDKIQTEVTEILAEIDRTSAGTKWLGTAVLDGAFSAEFQIGPENDASTSQISITLSDDLSSSGLGIDAMDLSTQAGAQAAIDLLDTALGTINTALANIGASQNRLEFASANIAIGIENKSAAESVIRDVDMAWEMVSFTKNQILIQSGTAMLAQANMSNQSVLALFGG